MSEIKRRKRSLFDLMNEYMHDLEELSEELAEAVGPGGPSWDLKSCCVEALCNVTVSHDEVVVTADLPNTNPDKISVDQIDHDTLEIKAEMKRKVQFKEFGVTHREGEFQYFRCQPHIPVVVDMKHMKTRFRRGILEIRLPRRKGVRVKVE